MILKTIWTLPQNILGLLMFLVIKCRGAVSVSKKAGNGMIVTRWKSTAGLSIGQFLFLHSGADEATIRHEYGHYKQGLQLGWLWLPIVGLPSLLWCIWHICFGRKHGVDYFWFYTERWADKAGGVNREVAT